LNPTKQQKLPDALPASEGFCDLQFKPAAAHSIHAVSLSDSEHRIDAAQLNQRRDEEIQKACYLQLRTASL